MFSYREFNLKGLKGPIEINLNKPPLKWLELEAENSDNRKGGLYSPKNCISRNKVAILIPFRDRDRELRLIPDSYLFKK